MRSRTASTIIAGLLLMGPSGPALGKVTGITFGPRGPIVGHSVTAVATDDRKHEVAEWTWTCKLTDAGTYDRTSIQSEVPGRATFMLSCGGTYTVSLRVTYGGPMPPPPETVKAPLVIARPDGVEIIKGTDTPATYYGKSGMITIRSQVRSRGKDAGERLVGMAQQRVRNRTWWDGKKDPDQPWRPSAPGPHIEQAKGVISTWVTLEMDPGAWAKIRPGQTVVSWDADLRLLYSIGSARREGEWTTHGGGKAVTVECPLGTSHLSIVKLDDDQWVVRKAERAGAGGR